MALSEADHRLYVIADIHGRYDLFELLRRRIEDDLKRHPHEVPHAIFLGDYIDRGPQSSEVIDALCRGEFPIGLTALKGNHEEMLLAFWAQPDSFLPWRAVGGLETLVSYGVPVSEVVRNRGISEAHRIFQNRLPDHHLTFLQNLKTSLVDELYFFCHAGIRPGIALADQSERDLLWIREPFLSSKLPHGKVIIHGHTPVDTPDFRTNRINLDTGAYMTGQLCCLVLEGLSQRLLPD